MAHVADRLSVGELEERYRTCMDRLLLARAIRSRKRPTCFVQRLIEELLVRYNAVGPQALSDLRGNNGASPSVLKPELLAKLKVRLKEPPPGWRFVDKRQGCTLDGRRTRPGQSWRAAWMGSAQGERLR